MASLLWSIWLARNDCHFNNVKITYSNLAFIIKHRAYRWSVAAKLVSTGQENAWSCYPWQALTTHDKLLKKNLIDYWFSISDFICFTDGAWKVNQQQAREAGIGGFIMNKQKQIIFIFSGPSDQGSAHETEKEAFLFLMAHIENSNYAKAHFTFFIDAISLVHQINKQRGVKTTHDQLKIQENVLHNSNFVSMPSKESIVQNYCQAGSIKGEV